jgi:hypothetical protein
VDTNKLIQQLAGKTAPIRRLASPWRRSAIWLAISAPYVAAVALTHAIDFELAQITAARFVIEEIATLATALTAVFAAFWSTIPGHNRKLLLLPLIPLAVWLGTLGEACVNDWLRFGGAGIALRDDWECLPSAMAIGIVPAIAIVVMLRRGAPLIPNATLALAALAVAALGNFAMRFYHVGDIGIMVLVWHFGSVVLLALIASVLGRYVLRWQYVKGV